MSNLGDWKIIWDAERKCHVLCHIHEENGWMAACYRNNGTWVCCSCGRSGTPPEEIQFAAELAGCALTKTWYGLDYGKFERRMAGLEK